jgi:hypothetical protein
VKEADLEATSGCERGAAKACTYTIALLDSQEQQQYFDTTKHAASPLGVFCLWAVFAFAHAAAQCGTLNAWKFALLQQ